MKLGRRKRARDGVAEERSRLASELESARSALEVERERSAELERALENERRRRADPPGRPEPRSRSRSEGPSARLKAASREGTWTAARELAAAGMSQREIARRLELNRRTVARLVAAETPPRYRRKPQGSMLDPLEPLMRSMLSETPRIGAPDMTEALREHGYRGSVDLVRRRLRRMRTAG